MSQEKGENCKNCNEEFVGHFCNNCGQKASVRKIDLGYLINELQSTVLQHDKGLFYTIKELFYRPGYTIREYVEGKRVQHFKPIAFVLVLSTIFAFINYFFVAESSLISGMLGFTEGWNEYSTEDEISFTIIQWMADNYAYGVLLLLPFYSLASYLAFRKSGFNYYEHIVLNSFIVGQQTLVQILFVPIIKLCNTSSYEDVPEMLKFIFLTAFVFWTYFQFFQHKRFKSKLLLTILSYVIMIVIFLVLITITTAF